MIYAVREPIGVELAMHSSAAQFSCLHTTRKKSKFPLQEIDRFLAKFLQEITDNFLRLQEIGRKKLVIIEIIGFLQEIRVAHKRV